MWIKEINLRCEGEDNSTLEKKVLAILRARKLVLRDLHSVHWSGRSRC